MIYYDKYQEQQSASLRRWWHCMSNALKPGTMVRLVTPDNLRLHGAIARVESITTWGAYVKTPVAGSGQYRALFEEMEPAGPELGGDVVGETLAGSDTPVGLSYEPSSVKPVSTAFKRVNGNGKHTQPARWELTGNFCKACGGMNVVRTGSCETCQDCGDNSGCG